MVFLSCISKSLSLFNWHKYRIFCDRKKKIKKDVLLNSIFALKFKEMIIRKGEKKDIPSILALIKELAVFEKEPDAVVITEKDLEEDGFKENPLFKTFVAEVEGEVIGIALYYYRYSTWKGKTIHLEDLIVKESKRGTGAGSALYKKIIEQGKLEGVRRIEWNVLDWNTPAIEFYQKSGAKILEDWRVVQMDENGINQFLNLNS